MRSYVRVLIFWPERERTCFVCLWLDGCVAKPRSVVAKLNCKRSPERINNDTLGATTRRKQAMPCVKVRKSSENGSHYEQNEVAHN